MTRAPLPAILGGTPVVPHGEQPQWPQSGPLDIAALQEVTESGLWVGFRWRPAKWRAILEQVASATMGYRYGVGQANGTLAIASGLRAQLVTRGPRWADGRTEVLVPDLTCLPAYHGVLVGVCTQLRRMPVLIPIDARPDATMDDSETERYLTEHGERVLAILPTTLYGTYGAIDRMVELGRQYDVIVHHDDAEGGAARRDGLRAVTASVSAHADAKPTPTCEGGLTVTDNPEVAWALRADTDCGVGPGALDPVPEADLTQIAAGNSRMGEQPAILLLTQWLRALHGRLQARANRLELAPLLNSSFDAPLLWTPPVETEYPPFYMYYLLCEPALERHLGLTPEALRRIVTAEGIAVEPPFLPGHRDPRWQEWSVGRNFPGADHVYDRGLVCHTKYLSDPRFPEWIATILDRVSSHRTALAAALTA